MNAIQSSLSLLLAAAMLASPAAAKTLVPEAAPSHNKVLIRTDGLACYFCAYGLERSFKKTGRIAAFDMHMKDGIVEVTLIAGLPLVSARSLQQYVHDAGFTSRWIVVDLRGRFVRAAEGGLLFEVADTGDRLPVREAAQAAVVAAEDLGRWVRLKARGQVHESAPYALEVESYEPALGGGAGES